MAEAGWLWAVFTVLAAGGQTLRNAAQRELTASLGTLGATHVRFLFGFPFALIFLAIVASTSGPLPRPGPVFWPWIAAGALTQILATALMLAAMSERSFVVTVAYIKTEPVQVALFGLVFLGDRVTPGASAAILIATAGVIVMSWRPGQGAASRRPVLVGLGAGALFAVSAVAFRGAILSLEGVGFVMAATFTVAVALTLQAALLSLYLAIRNAAVLTAIAKAWRASLLAGLLGATASQFWFLAFALTSAANVRTLALVEVLFAQAVSRFAFRQPTTVRDAAGIGLVVVGVCLLVWTH